MIAELGTTPQDYFFKFVETLVEREAQTKWLDKTGDASHPLLTLQEHHELLASIAREMWQSSANTLRLDVLDVIVDLFAESRGRNPTFARQVRERIRNHSLLATEVGRGGLIEFDHDEFRRFYLGEALGRALIEQRQHADLLSVISPDRLPPDTCDQALIHFERAGVPRTVGLETVMTVARSASALSFARENCGSIVARLLSGDKSRSAPIEIEAIVFPLDSLLDRALSKVRFVKCQFEATWFGNSAFDQVEFHDCELERISIFAGQSLAGSKFVRCRINALTLFESGVERTLYGPADIYPVLRGGGATIAQDGAVEDARAIGVGDARIELVEKLLRIFLRATQVNEDIVRAKLGKLYAPLLDDVLLALVRSRVLLTVEYRGKGVQHRYKLGVPMQAIQDALVKSNGIFEKFLAHLN